MRFCLLKFGQLLVLSANPRELSAIPRELSAIPRTISFSLQSFEVVEEDMTDTLGTPRKL
jgi:hypothetical protein